MIEAAVVPAAVANINPGHMCRSVCVCGCMQSVCVCVCDIYTGLDNGWAVKDFVDQVKKNKKN